MMALAIHTMIRGSSIPSVRWGLDEKTFGLEQLVGHSGDFCVLLGDVQILEFRL